MYILESYTRQSKLDMDQDYFTISDIAYGYAKCETHNILLYNDIRLFTIQITDNVLYNLSIDIIKFNEEDKWRCLLFDMQYYDYEYHIHPFYRCEFKSYIFDQLIFNQRIKCEYTKILELKNISLTLQNGKIFATRPGV
jgi:hypothetical protein